MRGGAPNCLTRQSRVSETITHGGASPLKTDEACSSKMLITARRSLRRNRVTAPGTAAGTPYPPQRLEREVHAHRKEHALTQIEVRATTIPLLREVSDILILYA